jgi:hypothetical protein
MTASPETVSNSVYDTPTLQLIRIIKFYNFADDDRYQIVTW